MAENACLLYMLRIYSMHELTANIYRENFESLSEVVEFIIHKRFYQKLACALLKCHFRKFGFIRAISDKFVCR